MTASWVFLLLLLLLPLQGSDGAFPAFYSVADKLILTKVKQNLGLDKCKFGFTGAAPIMVETLEYFGALGVRGERPCLSSRSCCRTIKD